MPRVALLLRKSANRRLLNEEAVVAALREELGEGWEVRGHLCGGTAAAHASQAVLWSLLPLHLLLHHTSLAGAHRRVGRQQHLC